MRVYIVTICTGLYVDRFTTRVVFASSDEAALALVSPDASLGDLDVEVQGCDIPTTSLVTDLCVVSVCDNI